MSRKAVGVAIAVVLLTVVGAVAVPALAELSTDEKVLAQDDSTNNATACNYTELYQDASPSVVQVTTDRGQGSGFVYRLDNGTGYVVTNQHVVAGGPDRTVADETAEQVAVRFNDGETRTGNVTGTDVYTDLAVVRVGDTPVSATALPVAEEGPPVGERVAAIGSPFGLEGTMTHGIVSGVNRSMPTGADFRVPDTVQTDAPINPGSSGGPLVTCEGEVVGVNRAGGGDNVGFAVSPELVERVVPALIEDGNYSHPHLGIRSVPVTSTVAEANDLNASEGVIVIETTDGGPADGVLQPLDGTASVSGEEVPVGGDVVVAVDGRPVASQEQLGSYLATETSPGDEVELTVVRDGNRTTVTVTLGERPDPDERR
jgi:S1-C subfamily serine protease